MSKKRDWRSADPQEARESSRYRFPIPSREYVLETLEQEGRPLGFRELARILGLGKQRERTAMQSRLQAMIRDGQLITNRAGQYCLTGKVHVFPGTVVGHRDGYGFVVCDDEDQPDVYLSPRQMREVFHGDRVAVRIRGVDRRGRPEGTLVEVLERRTHEVVGRFFRERGMAHVLPDSARISHQIAVAPRDTGKAKNGQIVLVEITTQPTGSGPPIGRVVRILGEDNDPGIETEIAVYSHGIPKAWPEEVTQDLSRFGDRVPTAAKKGRVDLRNLPLVTIDGADARDFDDAVYCEPTPSGWRLLVAIADVSHYVQPGSALDEEAKRRGTSVYFPTEVIPMLPEKLSNGLCSLNPKVDRLCMVCEMRVNKQGKVTRSKFYRAVMRSAARLTYSEVAAMLLQGDKKLRKRHDALLPHLESLHDVFRAFLRVRHARGAIEFDMPEVRFRFGRDGRVSDVVPYERNDAHRLIEECMIAANVEAAKFLKRHRVPALFRVHAGPDPDRVDSLREFLGALGLRLARKKVVEPADYTALIRKVAGRPDAELVEMLLLRSMAPAVYQPANIGHFGLALDAYAHFTSPIRRYPDLLVHRGIGHILDHGKPAGFAYSRTAMEHLGHRCSEAERRADEATREALNWLKTEYMQDKVGETFDGIITGVTGFGLFVQLRGKQIEGLVHVSALGSDYYEYDAAGHCLVGERSGTTYRLTDSVRVKVVRADLDQRKIDFALADGKPGGTARLRRGRRRSR